MRNGSASDGSVLVRITGCEYKVTEEKLKEALSNWGKVKSEIKEELFLDPHDNDGTNRTGTYLLNMIIDTEIPEIIPLEGLRVKLQYQGVRKLCTICFGRHLRKDCEESKVTWTEYIKLFKEENPSIPDDFYGSNLERFDSSSKQKKKAKEQFVAPRNGLEWSALMKRIQTSGGPKPEDYSLPMTENDWNEMLMKMESCGIEKPKAIEMMKERRAKFTKACELYFSNGI